MASKWRFKRIDGQSRKAGKHPLTLYQAYQGGCLLGTVEKVAEKSYRSDGTGSRVSWGYRGYSISWRAQHKGAKLFEYAATARTRIAAADSLLEKY